MCHPAFFLLSVLSSLSAGCFEKNHSIVWHHWHDAGSPQKSGNMDFSEFSRQSSPIFFSALQKIGVGHLDRPKHPSHRRCYVGKWGNGFVLAANSCHQFPWAKFPGWELSFRRKVKKGAHFHFPPPNIHLQKCNEKTSHGEPHVTLFFHLFFLGGGGWQT